MRNKLDLKNLIHKYCVTIVAVLAFVLAFAAVAAFAGNYESPADVTSDGTGYETEQSVESTLPAENVLSGYGLYIDGEFIAAFEDELALDTALDLYGQLAASALDPEVPDETEFDEDAWGGSTFSAYEYAGTVNEIDIVAGEYPSDSFVSADEIGGLLENGVKDYSGSELGFELQLVFNRTAVYENTVEYPTESIYTDALAEGKIKTVTQGVDGQTVDTYLITYVDGVETERELIDSEVIAETVTEVLEVGTSSVGKVTASLGVLQKPYDGIITSYYGYRWGRLHAGIDLCKYHGICKGDPAYAAADGVVSFAGVYGGYGNCVIIDHGDGIQTLYAHFQSLSVTEGQVVSAGDEVGKIGMTGHATGYHLHFEVHIDGAAIDPLLFVDYN